MKAKIHKNNKFLITIISIFCLFQNFTAIAAPLEFRIAHEVAEDTPKGQMALRFKELIDKRLGNDVLNVKIYPDSSLVNDKKIGEWLLNGQVEMGAPSVSKLKKYTKRLQVFDIPFLFVSPEAADNFIKGPYGKRMLRLVRSKGLLGLGFLNNGMKQLSATKPIKTPGDFEDLKFRIMNSDVLEAQFKQINAVPLRTPFSKVYSLLKNNEIDGQENTWSNIYSKKFYEFQPYMIESNHGYLGYMVITSAKFWDSLPENIKPIVSQSLEEAIDHGNKIALEKAIGDKDKILETGASAIHTLTVEERKAWVTAMQPVWNSYKDEIGSELIQAAASAR